MVQTDGAGNLFRAVRLYQAIGGFAKIVQPSPCGQISLNFIKNRLISG
jgi:hypothetical protein